MANTSWTQKPHQNHHDSTFYLSFRAIGVPQWRQNQISGLPLGSFCLESTIDLKGKWPGVFCQNVGFEHHFDCTIESQPQSVEQNKKESFGIINFALIFLPLSFWSLVDTRVINPEKTRSFFLCETIFCRKDHSQKPGCCEQISGNWRRHGWSRSFFCQSLKSNGLKRLRTWKKT